MKQPADIAQLLQRRFVNNHRGWLAMQGEDRWPLELALGIPTEAFALRQPQAVREWADAWRGWHGPGELAWVERHWRALGTQRLPASLRLHGPAEVAAWAGQQQRWARARARSQALAERWPQLQSRLGKMFDVLADYEEADFDRLMEAVAWLCANPCSGLYLRQLPIAGMDSKWAETRRAILTELVSSVRGLAPEESDFYELCGLKRPAPQFRLRILDPALRAQVRGLGDITAPIGELAQIDLPARNVLVVENLQSGLALHDLPGAVAIMALGYAVDLLAGLPWVRRAQCFYWGDIDTHGFAILSRARAAIPLFRSLMMDEATLLRHRALWSVEPSQHGALELPNLTAAEAGLYQKLREHCFSEAVRLEQERVDWPYAWAVIEHHLR